MATAKQQSTKRIGLRMGGKDRNGKQVRGEIRAVGENQVLASLRRQASSPGRSEAPHQFRRHHQAKDLAIFTRQLATMMKAGVPLLQV